MYIYYGYSWDHINSFDDAKWKYDSIKPVNGSATPRSLDVRPLRERRYKTKRIVKLGNNAYALDDGLYTWMNINTGSASRTTDDELHRLAPIVWTRDSDGNEFIKISGPSEYKYCNGRYQLLADYLPKAMQFGSKGGKHYIILDDEEYALLPSNFRPKWSWQQSKNGPPKMDDNYLVFQRTGDTFKLVSKRLYHTKERVNRKLKAEYRDKVAAFWDWTMTMAPLLRDSDPDKASRNIMAASGCEYRLRDGLPARQRYETARLFNREIMATENHEHVVDLASVALSAVGYWHNEKLINGYEGRRWEWNRSIKKGKYVAYHVPPVDEEEAQRLHRNMKGRYHRWINEACMFNEYYNEGETV